MKRSLDPRRASFWYTTFPARSMVVGVLLLGVAAASLFLDSPADVVLAIGWTLVGLLRIASAIVTSMDRSRTGEVPPQAPLAQESDPNRRYQTLR